MNEIVRAYALRYTDLEEARAEFRRWRAANLKVAETTLRNVVAKEVGRPTKRESNDGSHQYVVLSLPSVDERQWGLTLYLDAQIWAPEDGFSFRVNGWVKVSEETYRKTGIIRLPTSVAPSQNQVTHQDGFAYVLLATLRLADDALDEERIVVASRDAAELGCRVLPWLAEACNTARHS